MAELSEFHGPDEQIIENRRCACCDISFSLTDRDINFYERLNVTPPTRCPACRQQRRTLQVNQMSLFRRACDATGEAIISHFPPELKVPVYSQAHWYSDAVQNTRYGREVDFTRPFFPQLDALSRVVPRPALFTDYLRDENCAYTNFAGLNKNCYLIFDSDESWDSYYGYSINNCRNSVDCYRGSDLELCYEAVDSRKCYGSAFISNCEGCSDSFFLKNCTGCRSCILCCNLRQKEYFVMNKPVGKEKYDEIRCSLTSARALSEVRATFETFQLKFPEKFLVGFQNENVLGNYLVNCKNGIVCFDCRDLWDGKYCYQAFMRTKDSMDCDECGDAELTYECANLGYNAYNCRFSSQCLNQLTNLTYCECCFNGCSDLFGCVGLRRRSHCILNREYSEQEYRELVERLERHMRDTGEWGEFPPAENSLFGYNLTVAQKFHPLTKEAAVAKGFRWRDDDERPELDCVSVPPDDIRDVTDEIAREVLGCTSCSKGYKIIPQELRFYRTMGLPIPRRCFACRHNARLRSRAPRELHNRGCDRCGTGLVSAFKPEAPRLVYCERCYLQSLE